MLVVFVPVLKLKMVQKGKDEVRQKEDVSLYIFLMSVRRRKVPDEIKGERKCKR